jgi:PAS domain S-box-containing protein
MLNVPGAIYRSAWHAGHVVELISDEIERIAGYLPSNFVASTRRTMLSIVHPDDRDGLKRAVEHAAEHERSFAIEYRIVRADGEVRWVLDRGQTVPGPGGRLWVDGAMFDITERRAAEEALRQHEIEQARTEELRASRVRIVEAADAARRRIERDLHDGAQQRLVLVSLTLKRRRRGPAARPPRRSSPRPPTSCARGWPSCATWPTASIRPCSASTGSPRRSTASSPARRSPSTFAWRPTARRRRSRPRSTSRSPRRSPTSPSTRRRRRLGHDRGRGRHARGRGQRRRRRRREPGGGSAARARGPAGRHRRHAHVHSRAGQGTTIRACAPLHGDA